MAKNFHEHFDRPELPLPPDRSTGLVFTAIAAVIAYFWRADPVVFFAALGTSAVLLVLSLVAPRVIRPLNIVWMKFAHLINKVMNPVITMVLFAIAIVPAGLIMQWLADPLQKRRRPGARSYWIERRPDTNASMTNQF